MRPGSIIAAAVAAVVFAAMMALMQGIEYIKEHKQCESKLLKSQA